MKEDEKIRSIAEIIANAYLPKNKPPSDFDIPRFYPPAEALLKAGYGDIQQALADFIRKIITLCKEHEKEYSHLCNSKKECHDETIRYIAVLRLRQQIEGLYYAETERGKEGANPCVTCDTVEVRCVDCPKEKQEPKHLEPFKPEMPIKVIFKDTEAEKTIADLKWKLAQIVDRFCIGSLDAVCGVGDTIYIPWVWFGEFGIAEVKITGMSIDDEGLQYHFNFDKDDVDLDDERFVMQYGEIYSYHFGAKWFLDKAKAEARLEELRVAE